MRKLSFINFVLIFFAIALISLPVIYTVEKAYRGPEFSIPSHLALPADSFEEFRAKVNKLNSRSTKAEKIDERIELLIARKEYLLTKREEINAKMKTLDDSSPEKKKLEEQSETFRKLKDDNFDQMMKLFDLKIALWGNNKIADNKSSTENKGSKTDRSSARSEAYQSDTKSDSSEIDLTKAKEILDRDHQGMNEVKEHILEYLAVQKRVPNAKGQVMCLLGPPGVGKTTLAKSVAEATGRKFVRISLAGVNSEYAIRGHDRSFLGAHAGKIAQAMKDAGTSNPVILLDEIDKMSEGGHHGDPAAALLEVLDPSQNHEFKDNYENQAIDLSKVMFIATSNSYKIPKPLLDRLEIVEVSRYTIEEKLSIARKNLIPTALKESGLSEKELSFSDEALIELIKEHTGESGVRQLTRMLGTMCRKVVKEFYDTGATSIQITPENLSKYIRQGQDLENHDYHTKLEKLSSLPLVYKKGQKELMELEAEKDGTSNTGLIKRYLDWLFSVPWLTKDRVNFDLKKARAVLDRDHQGLDKIKEAILEHLAVQTRVREAKPSVICLIGPPGVGKTTLAKSIAEATGRKFVRVSLGGVSTEHDIRGWARSYVSSQPGKIVHALKEAGTLNPVILLDEIDKMAKNHEHGDPAAALLEVLDPAQNTAFRDNFLELGIDLSQVMFIATANSHEIPQALLDRFEVIELSSYTLEEKLAIAKKSLLPKNLKENGLKPNQVIIKDETLISLIDNYTSEAGVRQLTRTMDSLCRKVHMELHDSKLESITITPAKLVKYLGNSKRRDNQPLTEHTVGVTQGLYWSQIGGGISRFEAVVVPGRGKIVRTGNLGEISQESIMAALTVAKKMLADYKIDPSYLADKDIHVHAPAGGKKDGPSAGITITTAIVSVITNIPVNKDVCMTGEISLHGDVLPIGGLKEKLIGAHKLGLKIAIIPIDNAADLDDVPQRVKNEMKIYPVKHISEVLKIALVSNAKPQR